MRLRPGAATKARNARRPPGSRAPIAVHRYGEPKGPGASTFRRVSQVADHRGATPADPTLWGLRRAHKLAVPPQAGNPPLAWAASSKDLSSVRTEPPTRKWAGRTPAPVLPGRCVLRPPGGPRGCGALPDDGKDEP